MGTQCPTVNGFRVATWTNWFSIEALNVLKRLWQPHGRHHCLSLNFATENLSCDANDFALLCYIRGVYLLESNREDRQERSPTVKISIIIPVYNEHLTLSQLLDRVEQATTNYETETILVDDCSIDGSREIILGQISHRANTIGVLRNINRGKGSAIREALRIVTGDIVLIQDADLEYSPFDYPRLLEPILQGHATVVYGSRFLNPTTLVGMSTMFRWGNRFLTWWTNLLFGSAITDMETCYRLCQPP